MRSIDLYYYNQLQDMKAKNRAIAERVNFSRRNYSFSAAIVGSAVLIGAILEAKYFCIDAPDIKRMESYIEELRGKIKRKLPANTPLKGVAINENIKADIDLNQTFLDKGIFDICSLYTKTESTFIRIVVGKGWHSVKLQSIYRKKNAQDETIFDEKVAVDQLTTKVIWRAIASSLRQLGCKDDEVLNIKRNTRDMFAKINHKNSEKAVAFSRKVI